MMRFTLAALCLLICAPIAALADSSDAGISMSALLNRTRFLSTEKAVATLAIANHTSQAVSLEPFSIVFLIYSGSQWREQLRLAAVSHIPPPIRIAPFSRSVMQVNLPSCTVYSDPCSENVIVRCSIKIDDKATVYQAPVPRYEFVPDPTATYDIDGLTANLPVFVAEGSASDIFFPDTLLLAFTASSLAVHPPFTTTPNFVFDLAEAMKSAGVPVDQVSFDVSGNTWRALLYIKNASKRRPAITTAVNSVTTRFRQQITAVSQRYVLTLGFNDEGLASKADSSARARAQEVAQLAGSGDLGPLSHWAGPPTYTLADPFAGRVPSSNSTELLFNQFILTDADPPSRVTVKADIQELYVGSDAVRANVPRDVIKITATAFRRPDWFLSPLRPQAVIAADRPELYVFGAASAKAALALGLDPYFAAIQNARAQALSLSRLLGVHANNESLFALYRDTDSDVRAIGLATTFSGGNWNRWQNTKADPAIWVGRMGDLRQTAMLPIAVPDDTTAITELSGARTTVTGDTLRLEVELDSADQAAAAVDAGGIVASLRRFSFVTDAAVRTDRSGGFRARYEVSLKNAEGSEVQRVADFLRAKYGSFKPAVNVATRPLEPHCGAVHERLLRAAIRQNELQARDDARNSGRRLRRLLLFAIFPEDAQNLVCAPLAQMPGPLASGYQGPESPLIDLTSMMVFRTFPAHGSDTAPP
jgi:hypothetical protein